MLKDEFETNPTNCWTLWYLLTHYYKIEDLPNYVSCGIVFINHTHKDERYTQVRGILSYIYQNVPLDLSLKAKLLEALGKNPPN